MMKIKNGRWMKVFLTILFVVLIGSEVGSAYASSVSKSETVYVKLNADGSSKEIIVTDWIRGGDFAEKFIDKTNLRNLKNVKNDVSPMKQGRDSVLWDSDGTDIYYQGKSDKQVPIDAQVRYFIDGKEFSPEQMIGKSGKVTVEMTLRNNSFRPVDTGGQYAVMATPFTAVAVLGFPTDKFKNLEAENAKIFSDGNNQIVVFIGFPGLNESLDLRKTNIDVLKDLEIPEKLVVTADVKNFEMAPIGIAASPELPDMIRDFEKPEELKEIRSDIDHLLSSKQKLHETDPNQAIKSLYVNESKTEAARLLVEDIFRFYDLDKALLDILPDYVTEENVSLYDRVHQHFKSAGVRKIWDNEVLKLIPDRITEENVNKAKVLIKDYDELKEFDGTKLDRIIEITEEYSGVDQAIEASFSVMDTLDAHQKELDVLEKFSEHSKQTLDLISDLESANMQYALTDEDIQVMLHALSQHKSEQIAKKFDDLIAEDGTVLKRETILFILNKSKQAGAISDQQAAGLIALVNTGNVGASGTPYHDLILTMADAAKGNVSSAVDAQMYQAKNEAESLLYRVQALQSDLQRDIGYDYLQQLYNTVYMIDDMMPDIRYLRDYARNNRKSLDEIKDLVNDSEDREDMKEWLQKFRQMKEHMDESGENIEILRDLLNEYDKEEVRHFKESIPQLREDIDEIYPILESMTKKLDEPLYHESLNNSPKTIRTLIEMKDDLEANRDISETLRLAMDDKIVQAAKDIIEIVERRDAEQNFEQVKDKMKWTDELFDRKETLQRLSEKYNIFTEKAEGMHSDVKFILQTEAIRKQEVKKEYVEKKEERLGFFGWLKQKLARG